jgi:hypothetical protein
MSPRDREWLRGFLRLDARADEGASIPQRDVERQEDTVLRALTLLEAQPGVVLADEVGMGKTYEALGVIAARCHERPHAKTLILTPGPDLNTKWKKELDACGDRQRPMYTGFTDKIGVAVNLAQLVISLREKQFVVAPINIFAGSRAVSDQRYLLSAWAESKELAGNQVAALFRRYRNGEFERVDTDTQEFLGAFAASEMKSPLRAALRAHRGASSGSLDALWKAGGYDAFGDTRAVESGLMDLRFRVIANLIPEIDLLVVDEAHKLKNSESVRATGMRTVFEKKFDKALFLTATPFQLTIEELAQVFTLFGLARSAPADLAQQSESLLTDVRAYTHAYGDFERSWQQLDGIGASDFEAWFEKDPHLAADPDEPSLRTLVVQARRLLQLKQERIEPGFRSWMIRSLREDKRTYRRSKRERLRAAGGPGVPFILYERFIAELFRTNARTHKAAVQINMVSSFRAAREGALLADEVRSTLAPSAEGYRQLLQQIVGTLRDSNQGGNHPKVDHVVRDALEAARNGDKTLIFCARVHTLHELKERLESEWNREMLAAWQRCFPGLGGEDIFDHTEDESRVRGRHSRLQTRFKGGQDALYLALRERYVSTLLGASDFAGEHLAEIVGRANALLAGLQVSKSHAERTDWSLLKRCVEQATALVLRDRGGSSHVDAGALERLLDPTFLTLGFDLEADDVESFSIGGHVPQWTIREQDARLVISKIHLWSYLTSFLVDIPAHLRVRTVERLASYLGSRYVPFLPDLLAYAKEQGLDLENIEARELLPIVDRFWTTPKGRPWCDLLRRFLVYAGKLDESRRREVLDDVVRAGAIVRHTVDGESRERLREAFNTPLYPMILVANEVMQEGLDLHHHCRRVVHHDLAWNPAQLEQRVGRVDRLGSLVQRLRVKQPDATLDITLPIIINTIDERLERAVRLRERWLEFLLGAPPKIEEYGLADEPIQPLPTAFSDALKVNLGPV